MNAPTRKEIFALAAKKMRQDFEELRNIPHAGTKGAEAEEILRKFLNSHLPKRFEARPGFIIDHQDNVSRQTDVIIYDAYNCPLYRASDDAAIIPNDNVAVVIEVKSSLDKTAIEDAADKIAVVKSLAKRQPPKEQGFVIYETLGMVFAFNTPLTIETLTTHYRESIRKHNLGRHIDFIFILDKGMLSLSINPGTVYGWSPFILYGSAPEGTHVAIGGMVLEQATLDAFVRTLLPHLSTFRGLVAHPGFNWGTAETGRKVRIEYLTTITYETDPVRQKERLARYAEEARRLIMGNE